MNIVKRWDEIADIWEKKMGDDGDLVHQLLINPVVFEFIEKVFKQHNTVIDIGCGNGYLIPKLEEFSLSVYGLDFSKNMLKYAEKRISNPDRLIHLNVEKPDKLILNKFLQKFDIAIANFLLDSLKNLEKAIATINMILKKDGYLIVSIAHPWFYIEHGNFLKDPSYLKEGKYYVKLNSLNFYLPYYFRRLETYFTTFRKHQFEFIEIKEPVKPNVFPKPIIISFLLQKIRDLK